MVQVTDLSFFLNKCQITNETEEQIILEASSDLAAFGLRRCALRMANWVAERGRKVAFLYFPEGGKVPYEFPASFKNEINPNSEGYLKMSNSPESNPEQLILNPLINPVTLRPDADYQQITEFMLERWQEGKSVCIVSMIDDRCLAQNDKLTPQRAVLQPHEWLGQNYRWYWRDSMDDYHRLINLLDRDKAVTQLQRSQPTIPQFAYRLRRPDGSLAEYQTDYYFVENYLGVPCRIGVSELSAWRLLERAS